MNELTINLRTKSDVPLYEQIYNYIKEDILCGRLKNTEKLPSTRALSKHLDVSRSTVEAAYAQLLSEGYIESFACRGYFITDVKELYRITPAQETIKKEAEKEDFYCFDFSPNGVDFNSFPYNIWRKLSKESLSGDKAELVRLGHPQGEYGLRNAICNYLHQARGVNCSPNQIIVGAGNDYLLMLLTTIWGTEHKVALENPTYRQAYRLFSNLSYEVCTVDMDHNGMSAEKLEQSGADIAFVMPSHQYPLGIVMPLKRRQELLTWAYKDVNRYIIEDDYDSEFRYKGKPIPALKGYDGKEKVIYIGTFSKSVTPALRVSYIVLPEPLLNEYKKKSRFLNSTVSTVDQLILQRFIEQGYYERHLNKMRALYKSRHDILLNALKTMPGIEKISGEHAGVHLLLHFKKGITEQELLRRAENQKIKVYGLSEYYVEQPQNSKAIILLGYANLNEKQIEEAVEILKKTWDFEHFSVS